MLYMKPKVNEVTTKLSAKMHAKIKKFKYYYHLILIASNQVATKQLFLEMSQTSTAIED